MSCSIPRVCFAYSHAAANTRSRCGSVVQLRAFSASPHPQSGHNRWSKIRHDKAKNDMGRNKQRSLYANEIALASKLFGADPHSNPRLALAITRAKKDGFPKASIEAAIARGQGVSASGAKLETVTVEAMVPPSVAVVVDSQTDSKLRTLNEIRLIIKEHGGQVAPTGYLFDRKGEIVFRPKEGVGMDEILETAVEAGALDIEDGLEGRLIVYSEPSATKHVSDVLMSQFDLEVESSEIIWDPNTRADLDSDASATNLVTMVEKLKDNSAVQGVYINAAQGATKEEVWDELESRVFA